MFLSLKILTCMLNHPGINQQAPSIESKSTQFLTDRQTDRQTERQIDRQTDLKLTLSFAFFCIQYLISKSYGPFFCQVSGLKENNDLFPCPAADLLKLWPLLCPPFIVYASIRPAFLSIIRSQRVMAPFMSTIFSISEH